MALPSRMISFLNFMSSKIDGIHWSLALKHWRPPETSFELIPKIPPKHANTMNNGWELGASHTPFVYACFSYPELISLGDRFTDRWV